MGNTLLILTSCFRGGSESIVYASVGTDVQFDPTKFLGKLSESIKMLDMRRALLLERISGNKRTLVEIKDTYAANNLGKKLYLSRCKIYVTNIKRCNASIEKIDAYHLNMMNIQHTIQDAMVTANVVDAMKQGSDAMKKVCAKLEETDVDGLLDTIDESSSIVNEVSKAISVDLGDDEMDELEGELKELMIDTPVAVVKPEPTTTNHSIVQREYIGIVEDANDDGVRLKQAALA